MNWTVFLNFKTKEVVSIYFYCFEKGEHCLEISLKLVSSQKVEKGLDIVFK